MSAETSASTRSAAFSGLSVEKVRAEQNFPLAIAAGVGAAAVGAVLWAVVTVTTKMELGLMAVAVGYLVGQAIKAAGQGVDAKFGYLGAACGFLGCAGGNVLSSIAFFAQARSLSFAQTLDVLSPDLVTRLAKATFDPIDLLFLAIGVYEGYVFSFKYRIAPAAA
ncbi:MAG: hypothetical protein ACLPX9_08555 [Rhodomicrobium sp.]